MLSGHGPRTERVARFFAAPFIAARIPPNVLTLLGGALSLLPAYLAAQREYLWAGLALALVAGFDAIDGAVARATNRATPFGGYLDSFVDRFADGVVLVGIGMGSPGGRLWWLVVGAALVGQYLTSYARARAYQDATPPPGTWRQFFERPERIVFLAVLLLGTGLAARFRPEIEVLFWGLALYAALTVFTALVRVAKVRRLLEQTHK